MATTSIFHSVYIEEPQKALALVCTLEEAMNAPEKDVVFSHPCVDASREEIREMFGDWNDGISDRQS